MKRKLVDALGFQAGWLACALGAAHGRPLLGVAVMGGFLAVHLALVDDRYAELARLLVAFAFGFLADSALVLLGAFSFPERAALGRPSTLWMAAMWAGFFAALGSALSWLRGRWVLAALLGAVAGPLSYLAGVRLGALDAGRSLVPLVALEWGLSMPLLLLLVEWKRVAEPAV